MPGFELIDDKEKQAVVDIFEKNNGVLFAHGFDALRSEGYKVRQFEQAITRKFGCKHALAVSSGTAAIKIAPKGDRYRPRR